MARENPNRTQQKKELKFGGVNKLEFVGQNTIKQSAVQILEICRQRPRFKLSAEY